MNEPVFVVTDVEVDGPWPGPNSMRSFASVAVTAAGDRLGQFEAVLEPRDPASFSVHDLPKEWFGDVAHTHEAIDDARGYANLLLALLRQRS